MFPSKKTQIERSEFITLYQASAFVAEITNKLGSQMKTAIQLSQQRQVDRTLIRAFVRKLLAELSTKAVISSEESKAKK